MILPSSTRVRPLPLPLQALPLIPWFCGRCSPLLGPLFGVLALFYPFVLPSVWLFLSLHVFQFLNRCRLPVYELPERLPPSLFLMKTL